MALLNTPADVTARLNAGAGPIRAGRHLHREPAVIGQTGIREVVELELDATQTEQFARSANALRAVSEQFEVLR